MERKFIIWGAAGHAKVLAGVIHRVGGVVSATIDIQPHVPSILGVPGFRGSDAFERWLSTVTNPSEYSGAIGIGGTHGEARLQVLNKMMAAGLNLKPLIDPCASVDETAIIGSGSHVLAGAVIAAEAKIGNACIVNHKTSVDHESTVGDGVHIAPGATICGLVKIQTCAFIGAGATVLPRLNIGQNSVIGAGAVVTRNIPNRSVAVGIPARTLSK